MFSNTTSKIFISTQSISKKSYPNLNSIPLRKKPFDRPKSSTLKPSFMMNKSKQGFSPEKNKQKTSMVTTKQKNKSPAIPPQILDQIVESNFEYFKEKLLAENKSVPSAHQLKLLSKTQKTVYGKDYKKQGLYVPTKTQRPTHKNSSNFDDVFKEKINGPTVYQQEFTPKAPEKHHKYSQCVYSNQQSPFYELTLYSSDFKNWGAKSGNVTLQTKPYQMIRDLPFSQKPTTYKQNYNYANKKMVINDENYLSKKVTYGPKISNKLKFSGASIKQKDYIAKKNRFAKSQAGTCIRSKMETLKVNKSSNNHNLKLKTEYKNQFLKRQANQFTKQHKSMNLNVQDLKKIISAL